MYYEIIITSNERFSGDADSRMLALDSACDLKFKFYKKEKQNNVNQNKKNMHQIFSFA